jgi:hypothetical protein
MCHKRLPLHIENGKTKTNQDKQPFSFFCRATERPVCPSLKVHKIENFFGSDFEFSVISLLVMLKY